MEKMKRRGVYRMKGGCTFHLGREKEDRESEKQGGKKEKSPRCQQEDRGEKRKGG